MKQTAEKKIKAFIDAAVGTPGAFLLSTNKQIKRDDVVIELETWALYNENLTKHGTLKLSLRSLIAKRYPKKSKKKVRR